jgi:hypothetical protein
MPAVSTAATLSLSDCRQAPTLSEMRSSTATSEISGRIANSLKQPGRSKPITGPRRQRALCSPQHSGHAPHGSLARAATRWPMWKPHTPSPTSTMRAQNSWPNNCKGASCSSRRFTRS